MRKLFFLVILTNFFFVYRTLAQVEPAIPLVVDSLYREDQIFFGFTYNLVVGQPKDINSSQFSGGFHTGFIRDFPVSERRNIAIGVGLGWSIDTYGQNLFIGREEGAEETYFQILDRNKIDFDRNRFSTQSIDLPLQFRWRTSTPESYKFWRVYAGLRPSYVYYFNSKFVQNNNTIRQTNIEELERLRLGATFTFGYNTFNFYFYYSLNSFFNKDAVIDNEPIDLRALQVGLMFYVL